jgi:hypothetical protein
MERSLPPGSYVFSVTLPDSPSLCVPAWLSFSVLEEDSVGINALRADLLDVPELRPVQLAPTNLNVEGMLGKGDKGRGFVASQESQIISGGYVNFIQKRL